MNPYQKLMARKRKWTPVQTEAGKVKEGAEETIFRALALRHMELPVGGFIEDRDRDSGGQPPPTAERLGGGGDTQPKPGTQRRKWTEKDAWSIWRSMVPILRHSSIRSHVREYHGGLRDQIGHPAAAVRHPIRLRKPQKPP